MYYVNPCLVILYQSQFNNYGFQLNIVLHTHMQMHAESYGRHNKDERHSSLKNIPPTLFERVVCERELETE